MTRAFARTVCSTFLILTLLFSVCSAQSGSAGTGVVSRPAQPRTESARPVDISDTLKSSPISPAKAVYFDPVQGSSSSDLVRRALTSNAELGAVRLDIERARARLQQARLRPNPVFDFEQTTGRWTGSQGESETSIGFALPLELGGKRGRRIDLARAELDAAEAEVADRERRLTGDVRAAYAEAFAAIRELEITGNINLLDERTARVVQIRVNEGESAPIELNLLQAEVERVKARRAIVEGRLQAVMLRLKNLAGFSPSELLRLSEDLAAPVLPEPPESLDAAVDLALKTRPDLRFARLYEWTTSIGATLRRSTESKRRTRMYP
jgi:cobalt-zinc-cadmium efflux system outer membrane protein